MNIYWRNRENHKAPKDAIFTCRPFFKHRSIRFQGVMNVFDELPSPSWHLKIKNRIDLPGRETWIQNVGTALSHKIEKVVLARCQILELEEKPDPFRIAAALQTKAEGAFVFCIQKGDKAFLGASPEKLFSRQGKKLVVEAIAGTRPRGATEDEETFFKKELLSNQKMLREITPVQTFLKERLTPFCEAPPIFSPLTVHKTQSVQHLYSQGTANLTRTISDETLLNAIHPTPALCGAPQQEAFDLIRKLEPFERGLYGGVIGWSFKDCSEWVVAIRSCLIEAKTVHLFSGAGIVEGSNGADEWDELNHKTKLFDDIFVL